MRLHVLTWLLLLTTAFSEHNKKKSGFGLTPKNMRLEKISKVKYYYEGEKIDKQIHAEVRTSNEKQSTSKLNTNNQEPLHSHEQDATVYKLAVSDVFTELLSFGIGARMGGVGVVAFLCLIAIAYSSQRRGGGRLFQSPRSRSPSIESQKI